MEWVVNFYDIALMEKIYEWPVGIKAKFVWIVNLLERQGFGEIGMPYVKALGNGLFEIRAQGKEGIGRAIFCVLPGRRITILNGFIKKTQKTPTQEIALSTRRMREVIAV